MGGSVFSLVKRCIVPLCCISVGIFVIHGYYLFWVCIGYTNQRSHGPVKDTPDLQSWLFEGLAL